MKRRALFILACSLLFVLPSCRFQKLLKNGSADEKYEGAVKLYTEKDYSRALQLFDQIGGLMRATDKSRKIAYYTAFCYYNQKDYTLASYYFKRYASGYPNTEEAEECMFMAAYCNFLSSPEYSLDQSVTYDAIKDLQLFTNTYPTSKRVSECNDLIDQLRAKLELKDFNIARMFYRMNEYAASITMLNNIIKDFPDSPHKEEVLFLIARSYYNYAQESITEKQKERFGKTVASCNDLIAQYPASRFLSETRQIREKASKALETVQAVQKKS